MSDNTRKQSPNPLTNMLSLFGRKSKDSKKAVRTLVSATQKELSKKEVRGLFELWNNALQTGDPQTVADRYSKQKGVCLLPTISDTPRYDNEAIVDYFTKFLKKKPSGKILEGKVLKGSEWAQDAGIYEFTMGIDGSKVKGRYSFNYIWEDGEWKISHHHSSFMPESVTLGTPITKKEVRDLFQLWNKALASKDPAKVTERYAKDAVLLPTVSDAARYDHPAINDYFVNFLKKKPQGKITEGEIIVGANWAQDAGIYEFTMGVDKSKVTARYSFVYVFEDGEWKISHHHSSVMPEGVLPSPITKKGVQNLFSLWNDALATDDPDAVAARYSKNALLLPTVSDKPRDSYDLIKDYFVSFLKKKPQGKIIESHVKVGVNWCEDAGIYEFTMGSDGSVVRARYSFVYVYEDGEWLIGHHHSSVMPESFL